jgi:hypothetical protein
VGVGDPRVPIYPHGYGYGDDLLPVGGYGAGYGYWFALLDTGLDRQNTWVLYPLTSLVGSLGRPSGWLVVSRLPQAQSVEALGHIPPTIVHLFFYFSKSFIHLNIPKFCLDF